MRSMTGFGRGEATSGPVTVTVELKTVNNRFKDVQLRMPREYGVWEPRVLALLRDGIGRGRLDAVVRRTGGVGGVQVAVDLDVADQYRRAIEALAERFKRPAGELSLAQLAALPGVLAVVEGEPDVAAEWDLCATAVESALSDLGRMRVAEGEALERDLRANVARMSALRAEVAELAEGLGERILRRMQERIARLVADRADATRIVQEAAVLADKADIAEELARLGSHLDQLVEALGGDDAVGRKLDFLLQEMNREVNTIGSKAAEHPVSERVVEMKTVLERLREQAANVE